jgi:DsbC/DsbD-like thiol-disulfide interchange protein
MIASFLRQMMANGAGAVWLVAASAMLTTARDAIGADASSWDGDARSAVRLVAGAAAKTGELRAGIELRLASGWKTYWRYPGDSGVPPIFDFSKSQNVKSVEVLWPVPHRFSDETGMSIGYKVGTVFPLHVVATNPARPAVLHLSVDYAICEKLCIPAKGRVSLELARTSTTFDAAIATAETQVPRVTPFNDPSPLAVRAVRLEPADPHPRVVVDVAAPSSQPLDLFVEGPSSDWSLPLPEPIDGATAPLRRFAFELDGLPPGMSAAEAIGARLRFTLTSGDQAIETTALLPK